jgi:hypothetical protein
MARDEFDPARGRDDAPELRESADHRLDCAEIRRGARLVDLARAELAAGRDVITFPGGDLDAGRPFHLPRVVRFGNRRGYAKLALEAGVPIVPSPPSAATSRI